MDLTTTAAVVLCLGLGALAGYAVGVLRGRLDAGARREETRADRAAEREAEVAEQALVREGLARLHDQMRDLEHTRVSWQSQLHQQVVDMRHSTDVLRRETASLSTALRRPQVRGRWGELHLRRAVELAGLVDRCDFTEQVRLDDGARRPDLVVHLAGGRQVVVDAKVPLDAYLDATSTDDPEEHQAHLTRHARQLRTHVDGLASRSYWRALPETPEFVVLFVPAESFLAAALETDPGLLEHAAGRQVVLATPTTLIALLRTVAHGWSHERLTDQAREVHRLARELHERLGTWGGHLDRLGGSLNTAVGHYNAAVGSLDTRVLVTARRLAELGVTEDELPPPRSLELRAVPRRAAPEDPDEGRTVAL